MLTSDGYVYMQGMSPSDILDSAIQIHYSNATTTLPVST
jgi:hypothetical protein